jgi:hypothetical protein
LAHNYRNAAQSMQYAAVCATMKFIRLLAHRMDSAVKHDGLAHVLEYDAAAPNLVACTDGHDAHGLANNEFSIFLSLSLGRHAAAATPD